MKQITQVDPPEELSSNAVGNSVDNLCTVICRVDVDSEWTFAERQAHYTGS
jgi:hypothetical protein